MTTIDYVDVDLEQVLETEYVVTEDVDVSNPTSKAQAWERLDRVANAVLSGKYYMVGGTIKEGDMLANNRVCALGVLLGEHPGVIFGYDSVISYTSSGDKLDAGDNGVADYYGINPDYRFSVSDLSVETKNKLGSLGMLRDYSEEYLTLVSVNDTCKTPWERADMLASIIRDRPDSLLSSDLVD